MAWNSPKRRCASCFSFFKISRVLHSQYFFKFSRRNQYFRPSGSVCRQLAATLSGCEIKTNITLQARKNISLQLSFMPLHFHSCPLHFPFICLSFPLFPAFPFMAFLPLHVVPFPLHVPFISTFPFISPHGVYFPFISPPTPHSVHLHFPEAGGYGEASLLVFKVFDTPRMSANREMMSQAL